MATASVKRRTKKKGKSNDEDVRQYETTIPPSLSEEVPVGSLTLNHQEASKSSYEDELAWCIAQLELGVLRSSTSKSQKDQHLKSMKILKSSKTQLPKKRQLMRSLFGDYRVKMKRQPLSALRQEISRVDTKKTKVEAAKPKLLETVGTYYRKKTDKNTLESVNEEPGTDFKFNFVV